MDGRQLWSCVGNHAVRWATCCTPRPTHATHAVDAVKAVHDVRSLRGTAQPVSLLRSSWPTSVEHAHQLLRDAVAALRPREPIACNGYRVGHICTCYLCTMTPFSQDPIVWRSSTRTTCARAVYMLSNCWKSTFSGEFRLGMCYT